MQGKRIGVISSIATNPNNDEEVDAQFAQALADLQAAGEPHDPPRCIFQSLSALYLALQPIFGAFPLSYITKNRVKL